MPRTTRLACGLLFVTAVACNQATPPTVDCATATVPTYAQLTILPTCTSCHSSSVSGGAREDAPAGVDFDSYALAKASAASGAAQVNSGFMPPAHEAQPTDAQKTAFYAWALCGTPQ